MKVIQIMFKMNVEVRLDVITMMTVNIVFGDVREIHRRFRGTCYLHDEDR